MDWNEVAAIGQCAGAVATFVAVVVSLYLSKNNRRSKVRIRISEPLTIVSKNSNLTRIKVKATNDGPAPITIESSSFYVSDGPRFSQPCGLPKKLDASESVEYELETSELAHTLRSVSKASGMTEITFRFIDSRDKVHEQKYKFDVDKY